MKRITFFILSIFCLTACNNELEKIEQPELVPQIELIIPAEEKVEVYSEANESECRIQTLWVVVFDGNTKRWAESIDVSKIAKNGQAAQLLPQLKHMPSSGNTVICIANMDALTLPTDTLSLTPSNINTYFRLQSKSFYSGGDYLPMYGEMTWSSSNYTCTMQRAVAKVQVQMGTSVSDVTTNFSAENVTYRIYNSGSAGRIKPDASFLGTTTTSTRDTKSFNLVQKNGVGENMTHAYIHEFSSSIRTGIGSGTGAVVAPNAFNAERQHIILDKDNGSGNHTFYRLDFYDNANELFLDTKRNHHYMFTINKVRSEGYTSIVQAQAYPGSNIEYTITVNDNFKYITSNGQYAIVSSMDTIKVSAGQQNNITVGSIRYQATSMPPIIGSMVNTSSSTGTGLTLNAPSSLSTTPGVPANIIVSVTAGFISGSITFKFGNITHTIPVVRE